MHSAAERLVTLPTRYRALDVENPEQLYLQDNTGALAGYVSQIAVLTGSVTAAVLAAMLLRMRNRRYRLMCEEQARDRDNDGIPDIYERG